MLAELAVEINFWYKAVMIIGQMAVVVDARQVSVIHVWVRSVTCRNSDLVEEVSRSECCRHRQGVGIDWLSLRAFECDSWA